MRFDEVRPGCRRSAARAYPRSTPTSPNLVWGISSLCFGARPVNAGFEQRRAIVSAGCRVPCVRGELAVGRGSSRRSLVYGGSQSDPNHDADMRIGAKLRGGEPILSGAVAAVVRYGTSPPRIVMAMPRRKPPRAGEAIVFLASLSLLGLAGSVRLGSP